MKYKSVVATKRGGPEVLQIVENELRPPRAREARINVLATSVGRTDIHYRYGVSPLSPKTPFVPGYEILGVVDAVGEGVTSAGVGDRVAALTGHGGYAETIYLGQEHLVHVPTTLDPAEAVTLILNYVTAHQMLHRTAQVKAGDKTLVIGASGGVGTALLQLGKVADLTMYGTASRSKHGVLAKLGATPIDYRNEDFVARINEETAGRGVDAVFDTIGGKYWSRSYQCVARGGILVAFGAMQLTTGEERVPSLLWGFFKLFALWPLIPDGRATTFYNIQTRREKEPAQFKQDVATLFEMLRAGKLKPALQDVVPLADVVSVHRQIDKALIAGKVVFNCE